LPQTAGCGGNCAIFAGSFEKAVHVSLRIHKPYVLLMGDETDPIYAKTGLGIAQWDADNCVGQVRLSPDTVDAGLPDVTLEQALEAGARTVVLGVVVIGGIIPPATLSVLREALGAWAGRCCRNAPASCRRAGVGSGSSALGRPHHRRSGTAGEHPRGDRKTTDRETG
jgi:hypothetical protein